MAQQAFDAVELGATIGLSEEKTLFYCRRRELGHVIGNYVVLTFDDFYGLFEGHLESLNEEDADEKVGSVELLPLWQRVKKRQEHRLHEAAPDDFVTALSQHSELMCIVAREIVQEIHALGDEVSILAGVLAAAAHGPEEITVDESRALHDVSLMMRKLLGGSSRENPPD